MHTCQCFTWSCNKNSISRERQPHPEHQQLYIRHIICIRLRLYSNFILVVSVLTATSRNVLSKIFLFFIKLIFTYFITPLSLKHSYFLLHHVSSSGHAAPLHAPALFTNLRMKRFFKSSPLYIALHFASTIHDKHFFQTWHPGGLRPLQFAQQGSLTPRQVIAGGL